MFFGGKFPLVNLFFLLYNFSVPKKTIILGCDMILELISSVSVISLMQFSTILGFGLQFSFFWFVFGVTLVNHSGLIPFLQIAS